MSWQPIETVPKDGTWIWVFTEDHYRDECAQCAARWVSEETEYWDQVSKNRKERRVEVSGHWDTQNGGYPIGWMPLPEPPPRT